MADSIDSSEPSASKRLSTAMMTIYQLCRSTDASTSATIVQAVETHTENLIRQYTDAPDKSQAPNTEKSKLRGSTDTDSDTQSTEDDPQHESTIAISRDCGLDELQRIRITLDSELIKLDINTKGNGLNKIVRNVSWDIDRLSQLFFDDIISTDMLARLGFLVEGCPMPKQPTAVVVSHLRRLAEDDNVPIEFRRFFDASARQQEVSTPNGALQQLHQIRCYRELYECFQTITQRVNKDSEIQEWLKAEGFEPSPGRAWKTIATNYLVKFSGLTGGQLRHGVSGIRQVNILVHQFGNGILPMLPFLVPFGLLRRLSCINATVMEPFCQGFQARVGAFQQLCDLVDTHVYQPFVRGDAELPLDIDCLREPGNQTLLEVIAGAHHAWNARRIDVM